MKKKTKTLKLKSVKCKECGEEFRVLKIRRPIFCSQGCQIFYDEKLGKRKAKQTGKNYSPYHWKSQKFWDDSAHSTHTPDTLTNREVLHEALGSPNGKAGKF